jgi:hypothetical protein
VNLEDTLVNLGAADDLRPLVRALCACARLQLPRAQHADPFNAAIVETAEAWAKDACPIGQVRKVWQRAQNTKGAFFTSVCVGAIANTDLDSLEQSVRQFAKQLPTALWLASEAGKHWSTKAGALAQVGKDPAAVAQVEKQERELCEMIRKL